MDDPYPVAARDRATNAIVQAPVGIMSYLDIFWLLGMLGLLGSWRVQQRSVAISRPPCHLVPQSPELRGNLVLR